MNTELFALTQLLTVFLQIIHKSIYKVCEEHMSEAQLGLRGILGTREAVQVLIQRCRVVNRVIVFIIGYSKDFDRVRRDKLMHILKNIGLDGKDFKIISQLYWGESAFISIDGEQSQNVKILRGVRQRCVLSPILFNIYFEHIFTKALVNSDKGILMNDQLLNNIRCADGTVIFADSLKDWQELTYILVSKVVKQKKLGIFNIVNFYLLYSFGHKILTYLETILSFVV